MILNLSFEYIIMLCILKLVFILVPQAD